MENRLQNIWTGMSEGEMSTAETRRIKAEHFE